MKKSFIAAIAAAVAGLVALSVFIAKSADEIDVSTENDVIISVKTELPDGLTPFSESAGTLPPMWKVTKDGHTLYMMGSMHAVPKSVYPLDAKVKAAYDSCTAVAVEHRNSDLTDMITQTQERDPYCGSGDELKNHLSARQYDLLLQAAAKSDIDTNELNRLLPWSVYSNLSAITGTGSETSDVSSAYGVDYIFQLLANIDHKSKYSIESDEDKASFYPDMPEDVLGLYIELELTTDSFADTLAAWQNGDLDRLYELTYTAPGLDPEQTEIFNKGVQYSVIDRNRKMEAKALEFLASGETVFFIAGTAHFCGPEGIPALLTASGCTVERVQ